MTSPKKHEYTTHDLKVHLDSLDRDALVSVTVLKGDSLSEAFADVAASVKGLDARNQIADPERGINPPGATHKIVKEGDHYRLQRARFSGGIAG